jgi:AcrR family transcriptional regulator
VLVPTPQPVGRVAGHRLGNDGLSARDWEQAALKAIATGGLVAVAVEPLARTLGVTKGSFYAHHRNRDELIVAALAGWARSHGDEGLAELAAIADPAQRLRELLTMVVNAVQPTAPSVHLSLLGDRNDPGVRDAFHRVNQARLELLAHTYRELGLPPDRAASRAEVPSGFRLSTNRRPNEWPETDDRLLAPN